MIVMGVALKNSAVDAVRKDTEMYCPLISGGFIPYRCDGEKCAWYALMPVEDGRSSVHGCAVKVIALALGSKKKP